jgi:hypothetical protein
MTVKEISSWRSQLLQLFLLARLINYRKFC